VTDLTEFLLARIAEDEGVARDVGEGYPRALLGPSAHSHAFKWLPARVLAECEAKRRIMEECADLASSEDVYTHADLILCALALPYADHPEYREAWRS